MHYIINHNAI